MNHNERSEIELEKIKKFFEEDRRKRVDLTCKRVCFRQISRTVIKMFVKILKRIFESIDKKMLIRANRNFFSNENEENATI